MDFLNWIYKTLHIFPLQIIIAELIVCSRLPKRKLHLLRMLVIIPFEFLFHSQFSELLGIPPIGSYFHFTYINLFFSVVYLISVFIIWFIYDLTFLKTMYYCAVSYLLQHIIAYLRYILFDSGIIPFPNEVLQKAISILFSVSLYLLLFLAAGKIFTKKQKIGNKTIVIFTFIMLMLISIVSSTINLLNMNTPVVMGYSVLVSILLFVILMINSVKDWAIHEKDVLELMFRNQEKQRKIYDQNIALMNIKYHDLKHMVNSMKNGTGSEESLKEIESILDVYDTKVETGNEYLNNVMQEKILFGTKAGIQFILNVSAKKLSFMSSADIYALFGNMLDNAIEAVKKHEKSQRVIYLTIKDDIGGILKIECLNYFEGEITFSNGLPITSKEDDFFHGYGTKSMKYICEKYGGAFTISAKDNWFRVNCVFALDH